MQLSDEEQVRKALDIDSWRNLSKEKFMSFVSVLPNMDKDVAIAIVGQFPEFKNLATGAITSMQASWDSAVSDNKDSQKKAQEAFNPYIGILERELERDQQTDEQRFPILELIREAAERLSLKDSENKAWLLRGLGILAGASAVAIAVAFAALGGKVDFDKGPLA